MLSTDATKSGFFSKLSNTGSSKCRQCFGSGSAFDGLPNPDLVPNADSNPDPGGLKRPKMKGKSGQKQIITGRLKSIRSNVIGTGTV
jgi:hypothetical protein